MQVVYNCGNKFKEISVNECFLYLGTLYFKITDTILNGDTANAINMEDGTFIYLDDNNMVIPVEKIEVMY